MIPTAGNRHHVGQTGGHAGLTVTVVAPDNHRAIRLERHTVKGTCTNRYYVRQAGRNIALAIIIPPTPRYHRAVALERQTVIKKCGNRHHVGQTRRNIGLAVPVVAPGNDAGWSPDS